MAVTVDGPSLDANVDPRFDRCPYFLIVDTDDLTFEAEENPNVSLGRRAGIQCAQLLIEKGVQVVLTGGCARNAHHALLTARIEVVVGCSGAVRRIIEQFTDNHLSSASAPNLIDRSVTRSPSAKDKAKSSAQSALMTTERRQGLRGGTGRRGIVQIWPPGPIPAEYCRPSQSRSKEDELQRLKHKAENMEEQVLKVRKRIRHLEEDE